MFELALLKGTVQHFGNTLICFLVVSYIRKSTLLCLHSKYEATAKPGSLAIVAVTRQPAETSESPQVHNPCKNHYLLF